MPGKKFVINSVGVRFPVLFLVLLGPLYGCATPVTEQPRSGFISDYSRLEAVSDNAYLYTSPQISEYRSFIIDAPVMLFRNQAPEEAQQFTDEEVEELSDYYLERMQKALTEDNGYLVVDESGPGVARIRIAITALDASIGAMNIAIATKITGAGLGGAAMEGELIDSLSQQQLAASVQWGSGSRILLAGLTKLGDAKRQINRWSARLRERIDIAHGNSVTGDDDRGRTTD